MSRRRPARSHLRPAPYTSDVATHAAASGARCTNCEAALHGPWCAACGERQPDHHDWTLGGLFHEALHAFTHLDGTLWRTLRTLVRAPGLLTTEYFAGRKSRYMRPFALFLVVNLAFFVIQPHTGLFRWRHDTYARSESRLARMEAVRATRQELPAAFRARFDATIDAKKKSLLLVHIPLFALAVAGVQARRRRPLAQHAVFAIHAYAFFAIYLGVVLVGAVFTFSGLAALARVTGLPALAAPLQGVSSLIGGEVGVSVLLTAGFGGWLLLAQRRVYGDSWVSGTLRAAALVGIVAYMVYASSQLLFEWTLWSL